MYIKKLKNEFVILGNTHYTVILLNFFVGMKIVEHVRDLVPTFRQRQQFSILGGDLMKQACLQLIEKCSLAAMPFHNHPIIGKLEHSFNVFWFVLSFCHCLHISKWSYVHQS
jgi:hypothetical protein